MSLFIHHHVPIRRILKQPFSKQNIMKGIVQAKMKTQSSFTRILVIPNLYWHKSEDIFWRKLVTNQFWWSLISIALTFDFHCVPYWFKMRGNDDRSFFFWQKLNFWAVGDYFWCFYVGFMIHFWSLTDVDTINWNCNKTVRKWNESGWIMTELQFRKNRALNMCKIWPWNNLLVIITSLGLIDSSNFPSWHELHHGTNSRI